MTFRRFVFMVAMAFHGSTAAAGPWPREQGTGFVQLGFSTIGYNKAYGDNSQKHNLAADVRDNVAQVFAEYGLPSGFTVSTMVPVKFLTAKPHTPGLAKVTNSGLADIDLTVRKTWAHNDGFALATEMLLGLPVGSRSDPNGLFLGDGEFNVTPRAVVGQSFYPLPLYLIADLGFNFRTNNFSHDVPYGLEIGYGAFERTLYIILQISGRESLSNKPTLATGASVAESTANALGLHGNSMEYLAIIGKLYFKPSDRIGVSLSYATAGHGRNVAGGIVLAGGVLFEF